MINLKNGRKIEINGSTKIVNSGRISKQDVSTLWLKHFCKAHNSIVDKNHINECSLIRQHKETIAYNKMLESESMYSMKRD